MEATSTSTSARPASTTSLALGNPELFLRDGDHDYDDIGLFGGLQLDWKATHRLTPYARYRLMAGLFTSVSHQVEIGVSYAIGRNVRLLGGYRFWKFQEEDFFVIFGPGTDIDLEIHGLVLGVEFKF